MLDLYEQNRVPPSNDVEGATGSEATSQAAAKVPASNGENATTNSDSHTGATSSRLETSKPGASQTGLESSANHVEHPPQTMAEAAIMRVAGMKSGIEDESKGKILPHKENLQEGQEMLRYRSGYGEEQESNVGRNEMKDAAENVKHSNRNPDHRDGTFVRPPQEVIKKIDRDKVKAALEKRRKVSGGHITKTTEVMDEDDLIERELEDGIELAAQRRKNKQDRRQNWSKLSDHRSDNGNEHHQGTRSLSSSEHDLSTVEEGEVSALDDIGQSPKSGNRKRKASTSPDRVPEVKFDYMEDGSKFSWIGNS